MSKATELTYGQAANEALRRALREIPETILYGEDVAKPGGVFGVSKRLQEQFGSDRVFDTPISETAMLGAAVGAAMTGLRPIVEILFMDFTLVAADQIINQAANVRYVSAGKLSAPLTIRTQQGTLMGSCAQHSQCLEGLYAHIPGLRIGVPATAQDAYSVLLSGIACEDPTLIIEHRALYFDVKDYVILDAPIEPIGKAHTVRVGRDLTVVTWGAMLQPVLKASNQLEASGIDIEVVNARWIAPFDWETLFNSVAKTRRLLVVHEANVTGGFGAEIAARVQEKFHGVMVAPVKRVGALDARIPAAPHLQTAVLPGVDTIAAAVRAVIRS